VPQAGAAPEQSRCLPGLAELALDVVLFGEAEAPEGLDAGVGRLERGVGGRLYQVAPISTNLILSYIAEHVLGMPRSY
jgi:hypothetical protein